MSQFIPPLVPALDANAEAISGARWFFYRRGTLTPAPAYSDADRLVSLGTTVIADAAARFPAVYLDPDFDYRVILKDADGVTLFDQDPYYSKDPAITAEEETRENAVAAEAATRETADTALSERVDLLEGTTTSGIRAYATWDDAEEAFADYDDVEAYTVNRTQIDQSAFWLCIQDSTGNEPPTLPTTSNAYWRLITDTPAGLSAQVSASDTGDHTDPVVGGTVDNAGIFRYSLDPAGLERIADLDSQVAAVHAADAEAAAAVLGGAAALGQLATKPSEVAGEIEWQTRLQLGDQPSLATDLTDGNLYQFLGSLSNPDTRFDTAEVGTEIEFTSTDGSGNIFPVGVLTGLQTRAGGVYTVRGRLTAGPEATNGVVMALQTTAPTLGGAVGNFHSGACMIVVRCNGTITIQNYLINGTFPGSAVSGGGIATFTTEEVTITLELTSATAGNLHISIGGIPQGVRTISGLPSAPYFGGGLRVTGNTTEGFLSEITAYGVSLDVPRRMYANSAASPGGTGSRSSPFSSLAEIQAAIDHDTAREDLDIVLSGTYRGELVIDATQRKRVRIVGSVGKKALIKASVEIETAWTQIDTGEYWYTDNPGYVGNANYGGLTEVTEGVSMDYGRTGSYTVEDFVPYARHTQNTAISETYFIRGTSSVHTTGDYAGMIVVRCLDGGDPNDKDFEFSNKSSAITVIASNDASTQNGCEVTLENIEARYSFLYNFRVENCLYRFNNLETRGGNGHGYEINHSSGWAFNCTAEGILFDSYHAGGTGTVPESKLHHLHVNCKSLGNGYFVSGSGLQVFGDGWSLHDPDSHHLCLVNCTAIAAGKDGIANPGSGDLVNFVARDCHGAGITNYGESGYVSTTINAFGGELEGNAYGINANTDTLAGITRTINADGVRMKANATNNMLAYGTGAGASAVINATDCKYLGAEPSNGHKSDKDTNVVGGNTRGTINIETSTPAT